MTGKLNVEVGRVCAHAQFLHIRLDRGIGPYLDTRPSRSNTGKTQCRRDVRIRREGKRSLARVPWKISTGLFRLSTEMFFSTR